MLAAEKTLYHILSSVRYTLLSVKLNYSTMEYTSQAGVHNYEIIITTDLILQHRLSWVTFNVSSM